MGLIITLLLIGASLFLILGYTILNSISPMPSSYRASREMCKWLEDEPKIYDLGSGWGSLAYFIAKQRPDTMVIGIENSPIPYLFSKLVFHRKNLQFVYGNFLKMDLKDRVCLCYLCPTIMQKIAKKCSQEKPFKRLISNTFALQGFKEKEKKEIKALQTYQLYLYEL